MRFLIPLLLAASAAHAEFTYPVDIEAQYQFIDTDTCETVGNIRDWPATDPDTYTCPLCGIDPGFPANYKPLLVLDGVPLPDYDPFLSRVERPWIICGPDVDTCYDARCTQTDVLQQIAEVVDLTEAQRLQGVNNRAAEALLDSISDNERDLMLFLTAGMLMQLVDGASLPTDVQGVNFANLYQNYKTKIQQTAQPVLIRRNELRERVQANTVQEGEIDQGWPAPLLLASVGKYASDDPTLPSGWTSIRAGTISAYGSTLLFAKIADGTEAGQTVSVGNPDTSSRYMRGNVIRITGFDYTIATGIEHDRTVYTGRDLRAEDLAPSWGSTDLWIFLAYWADDFGTSSGFSDKGNGWNWATNDTGYYGAGTGSNDSIVFELSWVYNTDTSVTAATEINQSNVLSETEASIGYTIAIRGTYDG